MSKKPNIAKLIEKGTIKKRALVLAEEYARHRFYKKPMFTDNEIQALADSFESPAELKMYNKIRELDDMVVKAILNLQGAALEAKLKKINLRAHLMTLNALEEAEHLANRILHELPQKQRKEILKKLGRDDTPLFTEINTDPEGYLELKTDFEREVYFDANGNPTEKPRKTRELCLADTLEYVAEAAISHARKFIGYRDALLDVMEKEGFKVKTYEDMINNMSRDALDAPLQYSKYLPNKTFLGGDDEPKRVDTLKVFYTPAPDLNTLERDKKAYDFFRKNMDT